MRAAAAILAMAAMLAVGCVKRTNQPPRRLTGTCNGACSYYMACKGKDDPQTQAACVGECQIIFEDDSESLRAFESLECGDAVKFVEGDSGREPGDPPPGKAGKPPPASATSASPPTSR